MLSRQSSYDSGGTSLPGPSSTDKGFPVLRTGSPMVMPDCEHDDETGTADYFIFKQTYGLFVNLDGDLVACLSKSQDRPCLSY